MPLLGTAALIVATRSVPENSPTLGGIRNTRRVTSMRLRLLALSGATALVLAGCGDGSEGGSATAPSYDSGVVTARILPQMADVGAETAAAADAAWVVDAQVAQADEGTEVELHALQDGSWKVVDTAATDEDGRVDLTSPASGDLHVVAEVDGKDVGAKVSTDDAPEVSFEDDFDENSVHGDNTWQTRAQGHVGVRMCSEAVDEAAEVTDGVLRLSVMDDPDREECPHVKGQDYLVNGHVGTENTYTFTHGFAAARVKFQSERGQHGAFWLQALGGQVPEGPVEGGTEIDVIEYFGDNHPRGGLTSFVYWFEEEYKKETEGGWVIDPDQYGSGWADEFHVFSVEWTPDSYIFRIDGQVTHRIEGPASQRESFLILSLLSSDYELKHLNGDLPVSMDVDWVRTWETGSKN
jgi:beta-glucanase (GH16 family)